MAQRPSKNAKPPAKRPQVSAPDATARDAIAAAALKLFSERGFASVSNKELGRAAGVNPALIYYYFKDKHDLFAFVIRKALADAEAVYEKRRGKKGAENALDAWLSSNVALSDEFSRFLKVIFDYAFSETRCATTDKAVASFYQREIDVLRSGLAGERNSAPRAAELAELVSVFLDGVMVARVVRPKIKTDRLLGLLRELLGAGTR
jgi:TetR/AcrR family transcriptional regulator, upper aerobic nicotinate degradation pathway regulator